MKRVEVLVNEVGVELECCVGLCLERFVHLMVKKCWGSYN